MIKRWKNRILDVIPSQWVLYRKKKMSTYMAVSEEEIARQVNEQIWKEIKMICMILFLLFFCIACAVIKQLIPIDKKCIVRNAAGEGEQREAVTIDVNGEHFKYEMVVYEEQYTKKEQEKLFEDGFQYLEAEMLNQNKSMDCIRSDVKFLWEIPDSPIEVQWETQDDSLIDLDGNVHNENRKKGSEIVHIKLVLSYLNFEKTKTYSLTVYPKKKSDNEKKADLVFEKLKQVEKKSRTQNSFSIPLKFKNAIVQVGQEKNRWILMSGVVFTAGILFAARQWEVEEKKKTKVREASELEYSNILWQFVLLLEAGFTIETAWQQIVIDYEKKKSRINPERQYVYEQMAFAYHQMEIGDSMEQVFHMFSHKMKLRSYAKLMTLFLQNMTKGSKNMLHILKTEEQIAFANRCEQAKRIGEEADTKLLFPMGIMLLNVLLLLMIPAYLQF